MTTKELIDQYVTAHADNRWMDASELDAILTEFAEKLKEPAGEDLEQAAERYAIEKYHHKNLAVLPKRCEGCYAPIINAFKAGAQWQKEQMIKDAAEGQFDYNHIIVPYSELARVFPNGKDGDKVKVIIIKE